MSEEKSKFLLFSLNSLKRLEEISLKDQGKKEKYIEDFFVNSLENIFSDLVLLKQQCHLKNPVDGKDCIIDTLAFNKFNHWIQTGKGGGIVLSSSGLYVVFRRKW